MGLGIPPTHTYPHHHHRNSKLHDREEIEQNSENKSYYSILGDPKTVFEPYPNPKNSPLGPQKVKNDPKIKSKVDARIERNKENESCSTRRVDPKTVVENCSTT